jgi:hypothetical protein
MKKQLKTLLMGVATVTLVAALAACGGNTAETTDAADTTEETEEAVVEETAEAAELAEYTSDDGWTVQYDPANIEVEEGGGAVTFLYLGDPDHSTMATISYEADKMPEEVLGELTADWGDAESIERSEGIFPGTTDMWGYWRTLSQPAGSEEPSRTAIAGEYNGGTLLLQNTTYLTGDDAIDTAAADALETVVDSITYENFGPQTMYEYIPGTYTAEQDGATLSVTLNEDHSGVLSIQDDIDILWGSVELMAADGSFTYEYTLEGDNLYVNYDGEWTEFARQA